MKIIRSLTQHTPVLRFVFTALFMSHPKAAHV